MPTSRDGMKNRNVGQALVTSKLAPRNRNQDGANGGTGVSCDTVVDENESKVVGTILLGNWRQCTGCSMPKGHRKLIAISTKSRALKAKRSFG